MTNKSSSEQASFSDFGKSFQEKLVQIIIRDSAFADQIGEVLHSNYFETKSLQTLVTRVYQYKTKYKAHPGLDTIRTIVDADLTKEPQALRDQVKEFCENFLFSGSVIVVDEAFIKDRSLDFCKKQKLKEAMLKSIDLLQKSSFDEISTVINSALKLGLDTNFGHDYVRDFERRFETIGRNPISTGWPIIDDLCQGGLGKGELGVVIAPTGCHAPGTKVIMHDGSIKVVENVVEGDVLMGPDGSPRKVLNLVRGTDQMFEISPTKGEKFVVNKNHILSLVRYFYENREKKYGSRKIVDITVGEYLEKSKTFKHISKLYRSEGVNFGKNSVLPLDPYVFGLLVGDGGYSDSNSHQVSFTNMDNGLLDEIAEYMKTEYGLGIRVGCKKGGRAKQLTFTNGRSGLGRGKKNPLFVKLEEMGVRAPGKKDKFIPKAFLCSTREDRLSLLAGLLDTDGYYVNKGYEIVTKFDGLSDDILFLCRSLGFAAYLSDKHVKINGKELRYNRITINGNCEEVPCRIGYKKAGIRKQIKNWLVTGFKVKAVGEGEFYGFHLDGDHLYLLNDFTVMHNCGKSHMLVHLGAEALKLGKMVVHYTLELADIAVGSRYDSSLTGLPLSNLGYFKDSIFDQVNNVPGKLIIKEYPTKSVSIKGIRNHLEKLAQRAIVPDQIIVDYGDLLKPLSVGKERRFDLESVFEDLRGLAQEFQVPVWTASQTRRSSLNEEVITMESISESFAKCFVADFIFSLSRTIDDKLANTGRVFIAKNRFGPDGRVFPVFMDTAVSKIKVLPPPVEDEGLVKEDEASAIRSSHREAYRAARRQKKSDSEQKS